MDKDFLSLGYTFFPNLINQEMIKALKISIENQIEACAKDIECTKDKYLSTVSRWMAPSPVTSGINQKWIDTIAIRLSHWAGEEVVLNKMNVICKNAYSTGSVPLHQDISYSPTAPYQFTTWIALDNVKQNSGPLSVIPGSHLKGIFPAVDFWSPQYESIERDSLSLPIEKGDGICFDSRLWHGSPKSCTGTSRYAWVLRWSTKSWKLNEEIPPPKPLSFGMWTCGEETKQHLSEGINNPPKDLADLIDLYPQDPALEKIKILHLASTRHNGGDATGTVYKELWNQKKAQWRISHT